MSIIEALREQRQEDHEFVVAILSYIVKSCLAPYLNIHLLCVQSLSFDDEPGENATSNSPVSPLLLRLIFHSFSYQQLHGLRRRNGKFQNKQLSNVKLCTEHPDKISGVLYSAFPLCCIPCRTHCSPSSRQWNAS